MFFFHDVSARSEPSSGGDICWLKDKSTEAGRVLSLFLLFLSFLSGLVSCFILSSYLVLVSSLSRRCLHGNNNNDKDNNNKALKVHSVGSEFLFVLVVVKMSGVFGSELVNSSMSWGLI